jgi:SAM-dependent methyltransferase
MVAAGALPQARHRENLQEQFRRFRTSAHEIDVGLSHDETALYGELFPAPARLLLAGCGDGRDLAGLLRLGHLVTGIDQSPVLTARAIAHLERLGLRAEVRTALLQEAVFAETYDGIILAPHCYSNIPGSATRVALLRRLAEALLPEGHFVIHYVPEERGRSALTLALLRLGAWLGRSGWRPEAGDIFSPNVRNPANLKYTHRFLPGEVEQECRAAGLHVGGERPHDRQAVLWARASRSGADASV